MRSASCSAGLALLLLCRTACGDVVLSIYTGSSYTFASDLRVRQSATGSDATFHDVHWQPRPFAAAPYYGIRIAHYSQPATGLGISLDFTHYKMYAETERTAPVSGTWNHAPVNQSAPLSERIQNLEISHGVNLTALDVQYRWDPACDPGAAARGAHPTTAPSSRDPSSRNPCTASPHWLSYAGIGLAGYLPHAEGNLNSVPADANYPLAGFGGQIFAGTEYRLSRHVGLFVEGKFDAGHLSIDMHPATRIEAQVRTLHAIAGVSLHLW